MPPPNPNPNPTSDSTAGTDLFLQLRLIGENFQDYSIPLSVVEQLAELEDAIQDIITRQYLAEHPYATYLPEGLLEGIYIKLAGMGSASSSAGLGFRLAFACVDKPRADNQRPSWGFRCYARARDVMVSRMQRASEGLPPTEPLTDAEVKFYHGLSALLSEGGQMEVTTSSQASSMVLLTRDTCQQIVPAPPTRQTTEKVSFRGAVPEVNLANNTFSIRRLDGHKHTAEIPAGYRDTVRQLLKGHTEDVKAQAEFTGTGTLNQDGKLVQLVAVEVIRKLNSRDFGARLEELANLEVGWLEGGDELPPSQESLDWLEQRLAEHYDHECPLPTISPTPDHTISLEWRLGRICGWLEIEDGEHEGEWCRSHPDTEDTGERVLNLDDPADWQWLMDQIKSLNNSEIQRKEAQ